MNDLDTLHLETGLDGIPFGSSMEHVIDMLGTPDAQETDDDGDTTFEYEDLELTFFFWKDDFGALGSIGTERTGTKLLGHALVGETREVVVDLINKKFAGGISLEDSCVHEDGHIQSWIEVESMGITFWFDDGFLYLMDWTGEIATAADDDDDAKVEIPTAEAASESTAEPTSEPELELAKPAIAEEPVVAEQPVVKDTIATEVIPLPDDLMECWEGCYPDAAPIGFLVKREYPTLWLRIHSLPNAKRWPTEEAEWKTLLDRHYVCAAEVLKDGSECAVLVVDSAETTAEEVSAHAGLGATFIDLGPLHEDLWAKKKGVFKEPMNLFGLGIKWQTGAHRQFLRAIADNKIKGLVVELEAGCVYAPYDGGADLFYDSEEDRDEALKRHEAWLPPRNPKA
ncbi:MAG: hypothetical protein ACI97A_004116 [Planctomycetota bacterium]|jgi:hypothetical protein